VSQQEIDYGNTENMILILMTGTTTNVDTHMDGKKSLMRHAANPLSL
jgi:hypothetical protein